MTSVWKILDHKNLIHPRPTRRFEREAAFIVIAYKQIPFGKRRICLDKIWLLSGVSLKFEEGARP